MFSNNFLHFFNKILHFSFIIYTITSFVLYKTNMVQHQPLLAYFFYVAKTVFTFIIIRIGKLIYLYQCLCVCVCVFYQKTCVSVCGTKSSVYWITFCNFRIFLHWIAFNWITLVYNMMMMYGFWVYLVSRMNELRNDMGTLANVSQCK